MLFRARDKKSYGKHQQRRIDKAKRWNAKNAEVLRERAQSEEGRTKARAAVRRWASKNRETINVYRRALAKSDIGFRLRMNLAGRINQAVRYVWGHKSAKTLDLIGCTIAQLREHLQRQFKPGMSWENYGYGNDKWHIDHIRPCAIFDLTDPIEQQACFHFTNLQPLWQPDNFRKNKRFCDASTATI